MTDGSQETFVGMEYIQDEEKVPVYIKYKFRAPVKYDRIDFDGGNLHVRQLKNGEILCTLEKEISKILFDRICKFFDEPENVGKTNNFVLGYIHATLSKINDVILEEKDERGLFLVKPISIFDIYEIGIISQTDREIGGMAIWPAPFNLSLKDFDNSIHNTDFVDAITSYLTFSHDDCIRKIITLLENFFEISNDEKNGIFSKILQKIQGRQYGFNKLLKQHISGVDYGIEEKNLKILEKNLSYIYNLRCKIVHDRVRLSSKQRIICLKGLISAGYILQSGKTEIEKQNLSDLIQKFTSIDQYKLFDS